LRQSTSRGFPPIAAPDARVLILGSLPGVASLAAGQYYAQPRNAFWRIMGELLGAGPDVQYDQRAARLRASGIALWDVCETAVRPGSLDAAIDLQTVVTNDFTHFFQQHPRIAHVCANGATAHRLYLRRVQPALLEPWSSLPMHLLPSTSPAHASLCLAQKLECWRVLESLLAP
jgi:TDG/mug DNA glycosylase family protein